MQDIKQEDLIFSFLKDGDHHLRCNANYFSSLPKD